MGSRMAQNSNGSQTAEIKRAMSNAKILREEGPTSRQQTNSFVAWQRMADIMGQPFDVSNIPLSKLYQMRRDPMIAFALMFIRVPLVRAPWYIQCEDPKIAAFVDGALRRVYGRYVAQYTNSLEFGFQAIVKRFELANPDWTYVDKETGQQMRAWDDDDVKAVIWRPFTALPPETVFPCWTDDGDFDGIDYSLANSGLYGTADKFDPRKESYNKDIDVDHALWVTNEKDSVFGSLWGYPRIGYAYRYWWSYWYTWALSDRHYEKDADPATIVRYPQDRVVDDDTGDIINTREIALQIGEDIRSGSTVAMPSDAVQDIDGKNTGKYQWEISNITTGGNFGAFDDRFKYLDIMKLRSCMVPEQAFVEGSGSSSSRNVAAELGDSFNESQAVLMEQIDEHINCYLIPQLIQHNFPEFTGMCTKVTRGFSRADVALSKQLVQLIGQQDPDKLQVDVKEILDQAGVPTLSAQHIMAAQRRTEDMLKDVMPDPIDTPGSNADVDENGQYVAARPSIQLSSSEDEDLDSSKGEWHHPQARDRRFDDPAIREIGDNMFSTWRDAYADVYDSFAKLLRDRGGELQLADDDDEGDGSFASVIKAWIGTRFLKRAVEGSDKDLNKIMQLGSSTELAKVGITKPKFDADRPDAKKWLAERSGELLTNVSDTTKKEVRTWLGENAGKGLSPAQLADKFSEDFAEYPSFKAARVVRTELRDAYNAGTLMGAEAEGILHAIASDASGGRNVNTDQHCIDRNGRMFAIVDAMMETDHPNGTLSWALVPAGAELSEKPGLFKRALRRR